MFDAGASGGVGGEVSTRGLSGALSPVLIALPDMYQGGKHNVATQQEVQILAVALGEIGQCLRSYLASNSPADLQVRMAAHLAYALHNEALSASTGHSFDVEAALRKVAAINGVLGVDWSDPVGQRMRGEQTGI